jgi:hypothetical protein
MYLANSEPNRAQTGYMLFAKEHRPKIVSTSPTLKLSEINREIGKRWASLDPASKEVISL